MHLRKRFVTATQACREFGNNRQTVSTRYRQLYRTPISTMRSTTFSMKIARSEMRDNYVKQPLYLRFGERFNVRLCTRKQIVEKTLCAARYANDVLTPGLLHLKTTAQEWFSNKTTPELVHLPRKRQRHVASGKWRCCDVRPYDIPRLSPMEHIWRALDLRMRSRPIPPSPVPRFKMSFPKNEQHSPRTDSKVQFVGAKMRCCIPSFIAHWSHSLLIDFVASVLSGFEIRV